MIITDCTGSCELQKAIESNSLPVVIISGICLMVPTLLGVLINNIFLQRRNDVFFRSPLTYLVLVLVAIFFPDLVLVSYLFNHGVDIKMFWIIYQLRKILITFAVQLFFLRFNGFNFNKLFQILSFFVISSGCILSTCAQFVGSDNSTRISDVALIIQILGLILETIIIIRWWLHIFSVKYYNQEINLEQQCCGILTVLSFSLMYSFPLMWFVNGKPNWTNFSIIYIIIQQFFIVIFCLIIVFYYQELLRTEEKTEQTRELKQTFMRYMSHEMRTPLSAIMMGINYLEGMLASSGEVSEILIAIQEIKNSCEVVVRILDEMLSFDKIESNTYRLELTDVICRDFLDSICSAYRLQANHSNINFSLQCSSKITETFVISIDKNKFAQVIRNLISNALKFTPSGGSVTVNATLITDSSLPQSSQSFRLRVIDTGAGFVIDNKKIFMKDMTKFYPENLTSQGGSGLGLFISDHIMKMHGGALTAYSAGKDQGSTFTVLLPLKNSDLSPLDNTIHSMVRPFYGIGSSIRKSSSFRKPSRVALEADVSLESTSKEQILPMAHSTLFSNKDAKVSNLLIEPEEKTNYRVVPRILVVDDALSNRKMVSRLIRPRCIEIREASDGVEAVELVKQSIASLLQFDIILMDYVMPHMNGPEAVNKIRKLGFDKLIIGVTGNALPKDVQYFISEGANEVLIKPFNLNAFDKICIKYFDLIEKSTAH